MGIGRWIIVTLVIAAAGCKKRQAEVKEYPDVPVNPVEVALQVAAVSPNTLGTGRASTVMVSGAGFLAGAQVRIGALPASSVSFRSGNQLEVQLPALEPGLYDVMVINPDTRETTLRSGLTVRGQDTAVDPNRCGQIILYFGTDVSALTPSAQSLLGSVMDCFTSTSGPIRLDGHADERGTTDYNLALGQRRARSVQQQLVSAGIPGSRMDVNTYGEERPAERGWGESVWARNRRVEITLTQ